MDGFILFTLFAMLFALPGGILAIAAISAIALMAFAVYLKYMDWSIERGRRKFREEFGYDMDEAPDWMIVSTRSE
jgi:hypothetical protein